MRLAAALMAGGGERPLWPHGSGLPTPFLALGDHPTFLQQAYARLRAMPEVPEVLVLTAATTVGLVRQQLPTLPPTCVLGEPVSRGTAATAVLAAVLTQAALGEHGVLALVPADHAVFDPEGYRQALRAAYHAADQHRCPVLVGIRPTRPEPNYGYIRRGEALGAASVVARFVEKPSAAEAEALLADGQHLWNSGICVCRTDVLLGTLRLHQPALAAFAAGFGDGNPVLSSPTELEGRMEVLPRLSLDRALLEHAERVLVVEAAIGWDDVGNWEALARLQPGDDRGNVQLGRAVLSETERSLVYGAAEHRLVVTHGVHDLVVVDTADTTLVARRDALDGLQAAMDTAHALGFAAHLDAAVATAEGAVHSGTAEVHPSSVSPDERPAHGGGRVTEAEASRIVEKPWGREVWWAVTDTYAAKRLEVRAGHILSLQYHEKKHETLFFESGRARLRLGQEELEVGPGTVATVPTGYLHRIEALTDTVIIEISTPQLDDVVRLEDRYGRLVSDRPLPSRLPPTDPR